MDRHTDTHRCAKTHRTHAPIYRNSDAHRHTRRTHPQDIGFVHHPRASCWPCPRVRGCRDESQGPHRPPLTYQARMHGTHSQSPLPSCVCTHAHTHFLAHQHPPQPHKKQQTQARSEEPAQRHRGPAPRRARRARAGRSLRTGAEQWGPFRAPGAATAMASVGPAQTHHRSRHSGRGGAE